MEILGIDVGGSGIKGAPVDTQSGRLTARRKRIATPDGAHPASVAEITAAIVRHFCWTGPLGCCIPARVRQGVATTAANIDQAWIGTDAAALFSNATGCPVAVLNDADAAAVAEMRFGAGRELGGVVLLLTFGTGIGSALFNNRALLPNTEFGHLYLNGMVAEHYASDRIRKENDLGWDGWAERVQEYLDHVERLLDIDTFILGGGVSKPKKTAKYLHLLKTRARLMTAELMNEAGIIGAACVGESRGNLAEVLRNA
ncbi:MAG: ROK family protein [Rhodothermales bacterium]